MKTTAAALATTLLLGFLAPADETPGIELVKAARTQIGTTLRYDPAYEVLEYPNGDVPMEGGVCTDVVVRALRAAFSMDLQKLIHEDMKQNFAKYPHQWELKKPDKNIDHRRVLNMATYFKRQDYTCPVSKDAKDYQPGDLVTCIVPPHLPHIMIVSDQKGPDGNWLVIHNIGSGAREEDRLFEFEITGAYRIPASTVSNQAR